AGFFLKVRGDRLARPFRRRAGYLGLRLPQPLIWPFLRQSCDWIARPTAVVTSMPERLLATADDLTRRAVESWEVLQAVGGLRWSDSSNDLARSIERGGTGPRHRLPLGAI